MAASILDALAADWALEPTLHSRAQSWSWFRQAFGQALQNHAVASSSSWAVDEESLARAFFAWAELVELYAPYEAPVLRDIPAGAAAVPLTSFVLTLLQALHKNAGAAPLTLDAGAFAGPRWDSFLENIAEDSSNATCFLDQMTGLQPAWQSRSLIEHRPAMQKVLALARQRP